MNISPIQYITKKIDEQPTYFITEDDLYSRFSNIYILNIIIIIMVLSSLNPVYKELIAMEMYRNDMGVIYKDKHKNKWKKAIMSIFAVAILLGIMGVPIYNGILVLEDNAIPYDMGNIVEVSTATSLHMGDIIYYELTHFGARPSVAALDSDIGGALGAAGLSVLAYYAPFIADAIASSGYITIGSVTDIILTIIAGVSLGPISLIAIGALAGAIVGY
jgi:hypothetical protein